MILGALRPRIRTRALHRRLVSGGRLCRRGLGLRPRHKGCFLTVLHLLHMSVHVMRPTRILRPHEEALSLNAMQNSSMNLDSARRVHNTSD